MELLSVVTWLCCVLVITTQTIFEAEDASYTGTLMDRSAASNQKTVHLDQGEYIEWEFTTCLDSVSVQSGTVTHTNDGGSDTLLVYFDGEVGVSVITASKSDGGNGWNQPSEAYFTGPITLSSSIHSIKIEASSTDAYGVEIDKIELIFTDSTADVGDCYSNINGVTDQLHSKSTEDLFILRDDSVSTQCAEEDNILCTVLIHPKYNNLVHMDTISIYATYPVYFEHNPPNHRGADFTSCNFSSSDGSSVTETVSTLFDDGYLIIESLSISNWWLQQSMTVIVQGANGGSASDASYWRITQKLEDIDDWQQTFVMYQDGNIRLLPHPPLCYGDWLPFGSSIIIGNTVSDIQDDRPYAAIETVYISRSSNYKYLTADVVFVNGDSMKMAIATEADYTQITVTDIEFSNYSGALVTFRSMFVSDDNNDVDSVRINDITYDIMHIPTAVESSLFEFGRKCVSQHNTLSPDISISVNGSRNTAEPASYPTTNPTKNPTTNPKTNPTSNTANISTTSPMTAPSIATTTAEQSQQSIVTIENHVLNMIPSICTLVLSLIATVIVS